MVLADFPALLQCFTQHIWDTYQFAVAVDSNDESTTSISLWNLEENALNAFNPVPMLPDHNNIMILKMMIPCATIINPLCRFDEKIVQAVSAPELGVGQEDARAP